MASSNCKIERLGEEKYNNQGCLLKIIEYKNSQEVTVQFQDEHKYQTKTTYSNFTQGKVRNPYLKPTHNKGVKRIGEEKNNYQGCLMKIINYKDCHHIDVQFFEPQQIIIPNVKYEHFIDGSIKNPYYPEYMGIGSLGMKYPAYYEGKSTKEYSIWCVMMHRCFDEDFKIKYPAYKDVTCCKEWLCYENFFEWIIKQDNYDRWLQGKRWDIDKDILIKHNKIYSPDTCVLVPNYINTLFIRQETTRGNLPIGVRLHIINNNYVAQCRILGKSRQQHLGSYSSPEEAFQSYKNHKEKLIKQTAKEAYAIGEITKRCYEAMMKYEVEITD